MPLDTSKLDKEAKRKYWFEVIDNFNQSGGQLKEYCAVNGLKYDHMAYYLQQYRKQNQSTEQISTNFIPIQLDAVTNSQYIIKIDNSIEIKLPASHGITQVAALIAQIRKSSC